MEKQDIVKKSRNVREHSRLMDRIYGGALVGFLAAAATAATVNVIHDQYKPLQPKASYVFEQASNEFSRLSEKVAKEELTESERQSWTNDLATIVDRNYSHPAAVYRQEEDQFDKIKKGLGIASYVLLTGFAIATTASLADQVMTKRKRKELAKEYAPALI